MVSEEKAKEIHKKLVEKNGKWECPECGHGVSELHIAGREIIITCDNCGRIRRYEEKILMQ